jgi:response regulator RpfG family c-di-GMP phosphodiesterase
MHVLIVDDEPPIRRLLRAWTEPEATRVSEAGSAEEALALVAQEGAPAVALCDLRLLGQDGLWLAGQLRSVAPDTAVIMATAVHEFDAAVTSLQSGVVDYLLKPYTRDRLLEALRRGLLAHQSRRALTSLHEELERRRAQITEALAELELNASRSLEAMLGILKLRDAGSADHAQRVARLAVNLAMTLQIGEPQLSDIERAGLLHNLGRLAIPDELLLRRADSVSAAERARIRSYPLHGYAMLQNVPFLAAANELALAAHENWDGSGFPRGLRGEAIPLGARIISVANAYDELVSGLEGRPSVAPAAAIDLLSGARAAEFDPLVLGALKMLQPAT